MNENVLFDNNVDVYRILLKIQREKLKQNLTTDAATIENDTFHHASVLVSNLISHAKKSIDIYSSTFCSIFYLNPEVFNSFMKIDEKMTIRIIISHLSYVDTTDFKNILNAYETEYPLLTFEIYEGIVKDEETNTELNDFIVVDGISFRYEKENKDEVLKKLSMPCDDNKYNVEAFGCLRDRESAKFLLDAFNYSINNNLTKTLNI